MENKKNENSNLVDVTYPETESVSNNFTSNGPTLSIDQLQRLQNDERNRFFEQKYSFSNTETNAQDIQNNNIHMTDEEQFDEDENEEDGDTQNDNDGTITVTLPNVNDGRFFTKLIDPEDNASVESNGQDAGVMPQSQEEQNYLEEEAEVENDDQVAYNLSSEADEEEQFDEDEDLENESEYEDADEDDEEYDEEDEDEDDENEDDDVEDATLSALDNVVFFRGANMY